MKILIADDSATVRMILSGMLRKMGHEVVATADGFEAWDAFQKEYFPVVVADWQMPQIDGLVLCAMLRAKPATRYSYIILITGHGAAENYQKGIDAGADDFLPKPFDEGLLGARLIVANRIVSLHNHTRQLEEMMSVCAYCKCIRNEAKEWVNMEEFARAKFGIRSSHGFCPKCFASRVKPEMEQLGISADDLARAMLNGQDG